MRAFGPDSRVFACVCSTVFCVFRNGGGGGGGGVATVVVVTMEVAAVVVAVALVVLVVSLDMILCLQIVRLSCLLKRRYGPMDLRTDRPSYRDARTHLKKNAFDTFLDASVRRSVHSSITLL